jgi:hypothetical protein
LPDKIEASKTDYLRMARTYLVFGDIEGKLDVLRVECGPCQRKGRPPMPAD